MNGRIRQRYFWGQWWERVLTTVFVLAILLFGAGKLYAALYQERIFPGVAVGAWPLGGLTRAEAGAALQQAVDNLRQKGLVFVWNDKTVVAPMVQTAPTDPDLSYELISYDLDKTAREAYAVGRSGTFAEQWLSRLGALLGQVQLVPAFSWRPDKVLETLKANLSAFEQPGNNALLRLTDGRAVIMPESAGVVFDYQAAMQITSRQLAGLLFTPISLRQERQIPTITAASAAPLLPKVAELLAGPDLIIKYQDRTWPLTRVKLNELLEFKIGDKDKPVIGLAREKLVSLLQSITTELNVAPQEAKFRVENGKVAEFSPAVSGQEAMIDETLLLWEKAIISENASELALIVKTAAPASQIDEVNDLGIVELLGVGKSNFKGSPRNRRHNIAVGAAAVNGTLVAPGEEFSLLKVLGKVDAAAGYLPELVIKGNKTVPEFGGGLCQIGTTMFRATLAAGLPVTARRAHSYAVTYYNNEKGLPGTDATIYDPAPDYRFRNDTGHHVLIISKIKGDELFFEVWGTKDGRKFTQSEVRVWDRIPPGPTKLIETLDLKPGKKKCTEKPHAGMKASFDYTITYADGRVDKTTFNSQYRPWQEVCLVGVEKLSEDKMAPPGEGTEPVGTTGTTGIELAPEDSSAAILN